MKKITSAMAHFHTGIQLAHFQCRYSYQVIRPVRASRIAYFDLGYSKKVVTHCFSHSKCLIKSCWKILLTDKTVHRVHSSDAVTFREVATHSALGWQPGSLILNGNDQRRCVEWSSEDAFSFFLCERTRHSFQFSFSM